MDVRKLAPGDRILDYRVLERLGEGGFGEVFRAEHEVLGRIVAIKVPRDQGGLAALRHEGVVQASLEHPNIVRTLELSLSFDPPYVVMEYVKGSSLAELLKREGPLPWRRATRILLEVAQGLAHAHAHRVVHGDVKPANVLVEHARDGRVLLTDFGLGRVFEGAQGSLQISRSLELATSGAEVQGTLRYLAPEVLRGETADERADVYAFGVLLFECVTGRLPEGREVPSDLTRDLPPELDRVFTRAFTRLERRPRSLAATIEDLRAVLRAPTAPAATVVAGATPSPTVAPAAPAPPPSLHRCGPTVGPAPALPVLALPGPSAAPVRPASAAPARPATVAAGAGSCAPPAPERPVPALPADDPTLETWRAALLAHVSGAMAGVAGVAEGPGHGFDASWGVTTEGDPHHRVYARVLGDLDVAEARSTVATARAIFDREKGIWEKEVTFVVVARRLRDAEQVLWSFKSFSMGWWRRRRMVLLDVANDRLYATELGCDPHGNPLKRAVLDALRDGVRVVAPPADPSALAGRGQRRSVRGTAWGVALALLMATGLVGSALAIDFASRKARKRCGARRAIPTHVDLGGAIPAEATARPAGAIVEGSALDPVTGLSQALTEAIRRHEALQAEPAAPDPAGAGAAPEARPEGPPAREAFLPDEPRAPRYF